MINGEMNTYGASFWEYGKDFSHFLVFTMFVLPYSVNDVGANFVRP